MSEDPHSMTISRADALSYPYVPQELNPAYSDLLKRKVSWLFLSLACFAKRIQTKVITGYDQFDDHFLSRLTRICEGQSLPADFGSFSTDKMEKKATSSIVLATALQQKESQMLSSLPPNLPKFHQQIFLHAGHARTFVIFLVLPSTRTVEEYFIGDIELVDLRPAESKVTKVINHFFPNAKFTFRHRLQVPTTFIADRIWMAVILIHYLHCHGNYLDLNHDRILEHKHDATDMNNLLLCHDEYLGKLRIHRITLSSHPFVVAINADIDDLDDVVKSGWMPVDVDGDGNCGFYAFILGLENIQNYQYSTTMRHADQETMLTHPGWQQKIIDLRKNLQKHSQLLFSQRFTAGVKRPSFMDFSIDTDDELTERFVCPGLANEDYFTPDFGTNIDYHLSAFWGSYVFASLFKVRVIMIMRYASSSMGEVSYTWTTNTFEYKAPIEETDKEHVTFLQENDIQRLSDRLFNEIPTIEILYMASAVPNVNNHFQFLRRVICCNVPRPIDPPVESFRDVIRRHLPPTRNSVETPQNRGKKTVPPKRGKTTANKKSTTKDLKTSRKRKQASNANESMDASETESTGERAVTNRQKKGTKKATKTTKKQKSTPGAPGDEEAPHHLCTKVRTIYQQHNKHYCLTYSFASALFYCGFHKAASILASQASIIATSKLQPVMECLKQFMSNLVPEIGRPTVYGTRTRGHSRTRRIMTWECLFTELSPYPTIVIPLFPDGDTKHAFCVVDDLIFDSITPYALKLQRESVDWILNDMQLEIYEVLRFNTKYSPPGMKLATKYRRELVFHWDNIHISKDDSNAETDTDTMITMYSKHRISSY